MGLISISYSKLASFLRCPKQYKLQNIDKAEGAWSMWSIQGNTTHKLLEKLSVDPKRENIKKFGNELIAEGKFPVEQVLRAILDVEAWFDASKFRNKMLAAEKWFSLNINGVYKLNGIIDRLDQPTDDTLEVVDYKTGFYQYTDRDLAASVQLDIYALAVFEMYSVNRVIVTYENINGKPGNTTFSIPKYRTEQAEIKERISAYVENVKSSISENQFNANVGPHCRYCAFNKVCEDFKGFLAWNEMTPEMNIEDLFKIYDKAKAQEKYSKQVSWAVRERIGEMLTHSQITEAELDGLKADFKMGQLIIRGHIKSKEGEK